MPLQLAILRNTVARGRCALIREAALALRPIATANFSTTVIAGLCAPRSRSLTSMRCKSASSANASCDQPFSCRNWRRFFCKSFPNVHSDGAIACRLRIVAHELRRGGGRSTASLHDQSGGNWPARTAQLGCNQRRWKRAPCLGAFDGIDVRRECPVSGIAVWA